MTLESIHTVDAPQAIGPYSQAMRCGEWIFCSGQIPIDPHTNQPELFAGDVALQTALALSNLSAVLQAAGASLAHVVKTTVFLTSMQDFAAMNVVYEKYFAPHRPARSCVAVAQLPKNVAVEIDAVAVRSDASAR